MAILSLTIAAWWLGNQYLRPWLNGPLRQARESLGDGPFLRHLFSASLPVDLLCFALFLLFYRAKLIPAPQFRANARVIFKEGSVWGLLICLPAVPLAIQLGYRLGFHPDWQSMAGNVLSNTYEEFTYRFFLFSVAAYAFRNAWAGMLISSFLFAVVHGQYPLSMLLVVGLAGIFFSLAYLRSGSILAAIWAHQVSDMILDSILFR